MDYIINIKIYVIFLTIFISNLVNLASLLKIYLNSAQFALRLHNITKNLTKFSTICTSFA